MTLTATISVQQIHSEKTLIYAIAYTIHIFTHFLNFRMAAHFYSWWSNYSEIQYPTRRSVPDSDSYATPLWRVQFAMSTKAMPCKHCSYCGWVFLVTLSCWMVSDFGKA